MSKINIGERKDFTKVVPTISEEPIEKQCKWKQLK